MNKLRVVQMGLGPIGNKVTQYLLERDSIEIVGGIDSDPGKEGQDVGVLAGLAPLGVKVTSNLSQVLGHGNVDVVVLTTTSSLSKTYEQLMTLLPYRVNVVSSCEELSYPWLAQPDMAAQIDKLAKEHKVAVLGTGVNPGFLMDFLPISMTGICRSVQKVSVERIQDASFRRIPFQKKIGTGLTVTQFAQKVQEGTLRHVGLTESIHMIAKRMGWTLDKTEDVITPILAEKQVHCENVSIEAGNVLGVQQIGKGFVKGEEVVTLTFRAAVGEVGSRDRIVIEGVPRIDTCIEAGVNGDVATCAILVNAVQTVAKARAGLRTMADIEPISCFM
jgi:hypothetical protein